MRENNKIKLLNLLKEHSNLPVIFFANTEDSRILDYETTVYEDFYCDIEEIYDCGEDGYFTDIDDVIEMLEDMFEDEEKYKNLTNDEFYKEMKTYINENIEHFKAIVIKIF